MDNIFFIEHLSIEGGGGLRRFLRATVPGCQGSQQLPRVHHAVRVEYGLQLPHQGDLLGATGIVQKIAFQEAYAVFG